MQKIGLSIAVGTKMLCVSSVRKHFSSGDAGIPQIECMLAKVAYKQLPQSKLTVIHRLCDQCRKTSASAAIVEGDWLSNSCMECWSK